MEWQFKSSRVLIHRDGHTIELKAGSWREPFDIQPVINKGTSSSEVARLIREGLAFAAKSKPESRPTIRRKQSAAS